MDLCELALIAGDFFVPGKAVDIPACFKKLLDTDKIGHVLCTGNVGNVDGEIMSMLHTITPQVTVVRSEDEDSDANECEIVEIGKFKIALISAHKLAPSRSTIAQAQLLRKYECDILISGGAETPSFTEVSKGKFLISPGSISGRAANGILVKPSFMVMAITGHGSVGHLYTYTVKESEGTHAVLMTSFSK
eukprot:GDKJ01042096.1.p1 GENE.GDKJ01042096.1~~GDKJ01042096.1.p1  ORF type:complete len:199 (+),score=40.30 GDKJ01042096.1:25-597(+)